MFPRATGRRAPLLIAIIDVGLSRTEVAAAAGMSTAHLSRYINGRLSIPLKAADAIAKAVRKPVESLNDIDHGPKDSEQLALEKTGEARS